MNTPERQNSKHFFAVAIDKHGREAGIGRFDTIEELDAMYAHNTALGKRTEVRRLSLGQIETVLRHMSHKDLQAHANLYTEPLYKVAPPRV